MSILDKLVSYYPNKSATSQGVDTSLLSILQSNRHKQLILNLRESPEAVQKQLKDDLPCYTIAGTFSRRCEEGILLRSGFAGVDLDCAEDYDIPHLLNELKKFDCIAYGGLSCRGQRLYCIVLFKYPEKYAQQYECLIKSFIAAGLPMGDECHKAISQPRFVSWNDDTTQFFNHHAKPYDLLPPAKIFHSVKRSYTKGKINTGCNPLEIAGQMIREAIEGEKFFRLRAASYLLGGYAATGAVNDGEAIDYLKTEIEAKPGVRDLKAAFKTIEKCFSAGKLKPIEIHYKNEALLAEPKEIIKRVNEIFTDPASITVQEETIIPEPAPQSEKWDQQIAELETFFQSITLPVTPIKLNTHSTINDVSHFIQSHLSIVKTNNGKRIFEPYLERLIALSKLLK